MTTLKPPQTSNLTVMVFRAISRKVSRAVTTAATKKRGRLKGSKKKSHKKQDSEQYEGIEQQQLQHTAYEEGQLCMVECSVLE
jgi:hypothetical protein